VAFVHVALLPAMAASLTDVWTGSRASDSGSDSDRQLPAARCAVFYSIGGAHVGLKVS
jgi:hypothetical protein